MNTIQPVVTPILQETQQTSFPTTGDRLFTILFLLIPSFLILFYIFIIPIFVKPIEAKFELRGDVLILHVQKLSTNVGGFLVIEKADGGLPNLILESSNYLFPGTYKDFDIPILNDGSFDANYFANTLSNGRFFISFRKDKNNDKSIDYKIDNQIARDMFGRKIRLIVENGELRYY